MNRFKNHTLSKLWEFSGFLIALVCTTLVATTISCNVTGLPSTTNTVGEAELQNLTPPSLESTIETIIRAPSMTTTLKLADSGQTMVQFDTANGLLPNIQKQDELIMFLTDRGILEESIQTKFNRHNTKYTWIDPLKKLSYLVLYDEENNLSTLGITFDGSRQIVPTALDLLSPPKLATLVVVGSVLDGDDEDSNTPPQVYFGFVHQVDNWVIQHSYLLGQCGDVQANILSAKTTGSFSYFWNEPDAKIWLENNGHDYTKVWKWDELGTFESLITIVDSEIRKQCELYKP